jgi:hypothetical protein
MISTREKMVTILPFQLSAFVGKCLALLGHVQEHITLNQAF